MPGAPPPPPGDEVADGEDATSARARGRSTEAERAVLGGGEADGPMRECHLAAEGQSQLSTCMSSPTHGGHK